MKYFFDFPTILSLVMQFAKERFGGRSYLYHSFFQTFRVTFRGTLPLKSHRVNES